MESSPTRTILYYDPKCSDCILFLNGVAKVNCFAKTMKCKNIKLYGDATSYPLPKVFDMSTNTKYNGLEAFRWLMVTCNSLCVAGEIDKPTLAKVRRIIESRIDQQQTETPAVRPLVPCYSTTNQAVADNRSSINRNDVTVDPKRNVSPKADLPSTSKFFGVDSGRPKINSSVAYNPETVTDLKRTESFREMNSPKTRQTEKRVSFSQLAQNEYIPKISSERREDA